MITVKVARKVQEAEDICTFELVDVTGCPLPAFSAGSHIDVHIPNGLTRQYSLCNDPGESHRYLIGVLRDPMSRGGSQGMHDSVHEGDTLHISAPRNHFTLAHGAKRHLLLAGGIGITPILCMAERLAATGSDFDLHYCTRSKARTAFLDRIQGSGFTHRAAFYFDDGEGARKADIPGLLSKVDPDTHLYVCGPSGFLEFVIATAKSNGWNSANIHFEYFAPAAKPQQAGAFQVKLASSGRIIPISAEKTVVEALAECGVEIPISCEQGVCGTCLTRVLEGDIEHNDSYLTPEEQAKNDQFTPCCSRAKSSILVLDL
jgi:vanillate O-demethylase ferredoxin subunit